MSKLKSLSLNKRTVAILDNAELSSVKGGFTSALRGYTMCKTRQGCGPVCPPVRQIKIKFPKDNNLNCNKF